MSGKAIFGKVNQLVSVAVLEFSGGQTFQIEKNDIVLFIGPNNSGKSTALRDIIGKIIQPDKKPVVATRIEFRKNISGDELECWLSTNGVPNKLDPNVLFVRGANTNWRAAINEWKNSGSSFRYLAGVLFTSIFAEGRQGLSDPAHSFDPLTQEPSQPIQHLLNDPSLEKKFSGFFKKAFGTDLVVDRNAAQMIHLHVGEHPGIMPGEHEQSKTYLERLRKLPLLHTQGDGMRSYIGLLLKGLINENSILLIDEPEAFLHPPQSRLLGQTLAKESKQHTQLFISTHDAHFVRGLLDVASDRLRIIRLRREGDKNIATAIERDQLSRLWTDPGLRYSRAIDGLFHELVVLCEGDSDARFYEAISDAVVRDKSSKAGADMIFTHTGGKHRMKKFIDALKAAGVPTKVIVDIDVLNKEEVFRPILEAAGGDWSQIEAHWKILDADVQSNVRALSKDKLKELITSKIDSSATNDIEGLYTDVINALPMASSWQQVKKFGATAIPAGNATAAFNTVLSYCERFGIHILRVGELENFDKSVSRKGADWLNQVLNKDLAQAAELKIARDFVSAVVI